MGAWLLGYSHLGWASPHRFGDLSGLEWGVSKPLLVVVGVERSWIWVYWASRAFACYDSHWFRPPGRDFGSALRRSLAVFIHWMCDGVLPNTVG